MTYFDAWITVPAAIPDLAVQLGVDHDPEAKPRAWLPDGRKVFFAVKEGIESGRLQGGQVDPLTWAALLDRDELAAFVDELFGPPGQFEAKHESFPHLLNHMRDVRAALAAMPPDGCAAVVVDEF